MGYRYPDAQIPRRTGKHGPDPLPLYYVSEEELAAVKAVIPWLDRGTVLLLTGQQAAS